MSVLRLGRRAMGTLFEIVLSGPDERRLRSAAEDALEEIERLEEQLSLFLPSSELSRVNQRAVRAPQRVEPRLYDLLQRAEALRRETGGAFDVRIGALMEAWGFRGARATPPVSWPVLADDALLFGDGTVRLQGAGVRLDLGGLGKGYALDRAVERLLAHGVGCALLHGGTSTVYALGAPPGEDGWRVGLVDPRDPQHRFGSLLLRDQALSTSSPLGRGIEHDGERIGHVLDPRTGRPVARTAAWALADRAVETDALATAFLVLGVEQTRAYVSAHPGTGALVLGQRLRRIGLEPTWERSRRQVPGVNRRAFLAGSAAAAAAAFAVGMVPQGAHADEEPAPESVREVKVAVVGLGRQGRLLLGQLVGLKGVTIRALCDLRREALAAGLAVAGRGVETYADLAYMLEEETLDAVIVATPTHVHAAPVEAALAAGLHVFCEAPLAHTIQDCKAIVRAAEKAKRVFQTGHQRRTSNLYPHAQLHVESGAIGTVLQLRAQWNRKRSWRRAAADPKLARVLNWRLDRKTSGGLLLEQGSHIFDLAHWTLGKLPEAVSGFGSLLHWKDGRDVDDSAHVVLQFPGGVQVGYEASLVSSYGDERELIVGDAASILCLGQHKGLLFKEADAAAIGWEQYAQTEMLGASRGIVIDPEATKYASHEKAELTGAEADKADLQAELAAFLTSVRGGEKPLCGAREGMQAAVVGIVAAEAVAAKRVIEFTKEHFEV